MLLTTDLCYIYINISLAFRLANIVSTRPWVLFEYSLICDFWVILFLPDFLDCSCSLCIVVWAANLPALVLIGVLLLFDFPSLSISDVLLSLHFVHSAFCPSCNPYPGIENFGVSYNGLGLSTHWHFHVLRLYLSHFNIWWSADRYCNLHAHDIWTMYTCCHQAIVRHVYCI